MCISKDQEDTKNWKCCFCLSFAVGTFLLGLGNIFGLILACIYHTWIEAAAYGIFAVPYICVIFFSSSVGLRKCIYILGIIEFVFVVLALLIGIILTAVYFSSFIDTMCVPASYWSTEIVIETAFG